MAKQYKSVHKNWEVIAQPRDNKLYTYNLSGVPIKIILSKKSMVTFSSAEEFAFTVGGTIAQLVIPEDNYAYARAVVEENGYGTLLMDTNPIDLFDREDISSDFNDMTAEFMKLSNRVTNNEVGHVLASADAKETVRQFLKTQLENGTMIAAINTHLMTIRLEYLQQIIRTNKIENDFSKLKFTFNNLDIEKLQAIDEMSKDLTNLTSQVKILIDEVNNLLHSNSNVNLIKKNEDDIADHKKQFDEFTDALKLLITASNKTEVLQLFDTIAADTVAHSAAIEPLKELVLLVMNNQDVNIKQDVEIAQKVDKSDVDILGPHNKTLAEMIPLLDPDNYPD